jgi:hypothetical protein
MNPYLKYIRWPEGAPSSPEEPHAMGLKDLIPTITGLIREDPAADSLGSLGSLGSLVDAILVPGPDGKTLAINQSSGQVLQINAQGQFEPLGARLSPDSPSKTVKYKPIDQKPVIINSGTRQTVVPAPLPPPSPVLLAEGRHTFDELIKWSPYSLGSESGEAREAFALDFARDRAFRQKWLGQLARAVRQKVDNPWPPPAPTPPAAPSVPQRRQRMVDI